jgi:hypothetical protein
MVIDMPEIDSSSYREMERIVGLFRKTVNTEEEIGLESVSPEYTRLF